MLWSVVPEKRRGDRGQKNRASLLPEQARAVRAPEAPSALVHRVIYYTNVRGPVQ